MFELEKVGVGTRSLGSKRIDNDEGDGEEVKKV